MYKRFFIIRNALTNETNKVTAVYGKFSQDPPVFTPNEEDGTTGYSHSEPTLELNIYYFHPDHLGSSAYISNAAGVVTQHMEYLPFGETLTDEHSNSFNSPFKYNGKEYDEETGNYYYSARYYDPKWSIFISVDPLAEKTFSSYGYCYQNPINLVDPTGMSAGDPNDYVFDENGHYVRTDINDSPDMLVIENSKTKDKTYYTFNDPKNDVESIEYQKKIWKEEFSDFQFVFAVDDKWMDFFKKESGIEEKNPVSRTWFALTQSYAGDLDPSVALLPIILAVTDTARFYDPYDTMAGHGAMFIFQHDGYRVYNHMDAGNFIWGNFMIALGFNLSEAIDGAKFFNSNDTSGDINAIKRGASLERNNIYGPLPVKNIIKNDK